MTKKVLSIISAVFASTLLFHWGAMLQKKWFFAVALLAISTQGNTATSWPATAGPKVVAPPKVNVITIKTPPPPVVNGKSIQQARTPTPPPPPPPPRNMHQVLQAKKIAVQHHIVQKRMGELNSLAALSKDPSFDFLVTSAPFNRNLLEDMGKMFNMKNFSADKKDFIFIANHNQSLDDLIQKQKVVIRFGALRIIELQKNHGVSSDIRVFTTAGAAGKYRSGVFANLAVLSALKPLAGVKDYLRTKGNCGQNSNAPSQSGRNFIKDKRGQYMDGETGSSGMPANPDSITGTEEQSNGSGDSFTTFDGPGVHEEWVSWEDTNGQHSQMESGSYDFSDEEGYHYAPDAKEPKKEEAKSEPAKDPAPEATPEPEPEPAESDQPEQNPDTTPTEGDSRGGFVYSSCMGPNSSQSWECRKQKKERIFGSNDPLVLTENARGGSPIREPNNMRTNTNTHVGHLDPYILPTEEGGRGSHSSIGVDGCGGAIQSGRSVDNQFCYRVSGEGSSRCDGSNGTTGGPTDGGPTRGSPIPTPGPTPSPDAQFKK